MAKAILTLNAGSSSVKFGVFDAAQEPQELASGQVENLGANAQLLFDGQTFSLGTTDHVAAVSAILDTVSPVLGERQVGGVGHRIVHGGIDFDKPTELTWPVMDALGELIPLAPLHQPHNLAAARAAIEAFPKAIQIGCFDTSFHRDHSWVNDTFAIPRKYYDQGVRRYGFHGLSYSFIASEIARSYPDLHDGRVVVCHLGNGASMCAMRAGRSVASSMGFSALDGLPMGTRSGYIDPGVLLYLMEHDGLDAAALTNLLYKESGMKGLSGLTHDMRDLLASHAPQAKQAVDYYVHRIQLEIGAMAAALKGLDAIVFCGGVGENAPIIRDRIAQGMAWMGVGDDIPVLVIETDEERVIARAVTRAIS